jgi:hypothetical protein
MVAHRSAYPWSRYHANATGQPDECITPHLLYRRFGKTKEDRQAEYRALFKTKIKEKMLEEIRSSTNKAWVMGDDRFRKKIERQLNRRATPLDRGGDRKSERYRQNDGFNRVRPHRFIYMSKMESQCESISRELLFIQTTKIFTSICGVNGFGKTGY